MRGGPTSKVLNAVAYQAREAVLQFRYRHADVKLTSFRYRYADAKSLTSLRYAMFKSKSSDEAMIRSFKILQEHDPESVTMTLSSKPSGIVIPLHPYVRCSRFLTKQVLYLKRSSLLCSGMTTVR